ncbi:PREDICTED: uncharacterized protein LOC108555413 [Eufriesea mexicana]|uniref:uncharacterized protein LOC108555413 n=1 Tax=Eufriesea mexicana TaxID=516756 RepID=UPI00083BD041|nr:PREDICTED: uncharacterized protein LOC108555413 [Eufriesea mexicana]
MTRDSWRLRSNFHFEISRRIYVVVDEPILDRSSSRSKSSTGKSDDSVEIISAEDNESDAKFDFTEKDVSSLLVLSDIEILQCALSILREYDDDPGAPFRYLFAKTPPLYGRELKDTDRQMKILMKGFPQAKEKPFHEPFPEVRDIRSQSASKGSRRGKK